MCFIIRKYPKRLNGKVLSAGKGIAGSKGRKSRGVIGRGGKRPPIPSTENSLWLGQPWGQSAGTQQPLQGNNLLPSAPASRCVYTSSLLPIGNLG